MAENSMNLKQSYFRLDHLPTEIIMSIFEQLDTKSLINCFFVNKKLWDIAEYTAQYTGRWNKIVIEGILNRGLTYVTKSKLKWCEIFKNSLLWFHVDKADISHLYTYNIAFNQNDKVHVYRDNLIVVACNENVKYYNVENFMLIRKLEEKCLNYEENDHMIAILVDDYPNKKLKLYGKTSLHDFNLDDEKAVYHNQIKLYKIDSNHCYILVDRNLSYVLKWQNSSWKCSLVARYYGCDESVVLMHVFDGKLYIMLKWGPIMEGDITQNQYFPVVNLNIVTNGVDPFITMFHNFSAVVEVAPVPPVFMDASEYVDVKPYYITREEGDEPSVVLLKCPNLSCAMEHGEVLFLGYNNGKVKICIPSTWETWKCGKQKRIERDINIRELDRDATHTKILQLNVYEAKGAHHLFITTHNRLYQVLITYINSENFLWKRWSVDDIDISH